MLVLVHLIVLIHALALHLLLVLKLCLGNATHRLVVLGMEELLAWCRGVPLIDTLAMSNSDLFCRPPPPLHLGSLLGIMLLKTLRLHRA